MKKISLTILGILITINLFSQNDSLIQQIELNLLKSQYDSAIVKANSILELDTNSWQAYYYKGKSYQFKYKYFYAIKNYEIANKLDSANKIVENALAHMYDFIGKDEEAIDLYYNQYLRDTVVLEPIVKLANIFRKKKEFTPAIHYYQKAITVDPENFYYHKQLAFCYDKINIPVGAIYSYKTAIMLNPNDLSLYIQLANIFNSERMFSETIKTCNQGLEIQVDNSQLHKLKSYAYYLNHEFDSSIIGFNNLIEQGDSSFFNFKYRGLSFFEKKEFVNSIKDLSEAYGTNKTDAELVFYLGSALGRSNQNWDGMFYLNKSLELLSPSPKELLNIYSEMSLIFKNQEKYDKALEYLKLAYKANATPLLSFKMAQLCDYFLDNKKLAINYYDGFLIMVNPPESDEFKIEADASIDQTMIEYAENRIKVLKEEMFFEAGNKK